MFKLVYDVKENEQGKKFTQFYLVMENGNYIRIKNVFKDDFGILRLLATKKNEDWNWVFQAKFRVQG